MTVSLAMKPVMRAVETRQSPKPSGREDGGDPGAHGGQQAVGAVGHHVQPGVKGLEEPDDDGGHEDDGEGPGAESPWPCPSSSRPTLLAEGKR